MFDLEKQSMMIITYSGMAKSSALEAIDAADRGEQYETILRDVEENLRLAGEKHMEVLSYSAENNSDLKLDVLFIHAEDQMLNAETTYSMAKKMIRIHEKINEK